MRPVALFGALDGLKLTLRLSFPLSETASRPRFSVRFFARDEDRVLPLPMAEQADGTRTASYTYELWNLFRDVKRLSALRLVLLRNMEPVPFSLSGTFPGWTVENAEAETGLLPARPVSLRPGLRNLLAFPALNRKEQKKRLAAVLVRALYLPFYLVRPKPGRIAFCTERGSALSGNAALVYGALQNDHALELRVLAHGPRFSPKNLLRFFRLHASSAVIVVDDYYLFLSYVPRRKGRQTVQLWHAAGSLKTVGFSRLSHDTSLVQSSKNHRQYDAATVAGDRDVLCYAEGFGIPSRCVYPLGTPTCDALFDSAARQAARDRFFRAHPGFLQKRVVLFAPTFRGGGNGSAYYPTDRFPVDDLLRALPEDTVLAVKMHPYLSERFHAAPDLAHRFADCSDTDALNDLLFAADVLVTDYSSCVFEAAILGLPTVLYAFDLEAYTAQRDFYFDPRDLLPGPLVRTTEELARVLSQNDLAPERLPAFRENARSNDDGAALPRVAELVRALALGEKKGASS